MIMRESSFTVSGLDGGSRLDAFLARVLPCGVRGAKRLIKGGFVLVNKKMRPPQHRVPAGALVTVAAERAPSSSLAGSVRLVAANDEYAAFFKPAGLHTAHVAGGTVENLEDIVAQKWPDLRGSLTDAAPPLLLGRLDNPTSGLVLATFTPMAAARFRRFEAEGKVTKHYLAVVRGEANEPFVVENDLDMDNRKKTRVRDTSCADPTRHTTVAPLRPAPSLAGSGIPATLVEARIKRGARHQVRAHLAHAGLPILGDSLYGFSEDAFFLFLHHARLEFPGFSASCPPPWLPV